jgi:hypothetical protein
MRGGVRACVRGEELTFVAGFRIEGGTAVRASCWKVRRGEWICGAHGRVVEGFYNGVVGETRHNALYRLGGPLPRPQKRCACYVGSRVRGLK